MREVHWMGDGDARRYRVWTTVSDSYYTPPLTRAELIAEPCFEPLGSAEERLARIEANAAAASTTTWHGHGPVEAWFIQLDEFGEPRPEWG